MNFAFPKNFSRSFARMLTLSILMLALTSQAQETLHESVQVGHETTALVYSENGSEEIFRVEMKNSEQEKLEPEQEALFQKKRKSFSEKLVRLFSRKKNIDAGLLVVSDGDVQNIEFKDAKLNDVIPEAQKQSLYKKFLAPLIGSIYQLGKNEKTVFLKKSELGLSFVLQAYGVAGASKTGGGKLLGLGIDLGFDTKTNRLFASIYTTNGKFSAAASLPDAGFNLSGGFRSETSPDQTSLIKDYLLFDKMNISLQKQQRDPTKTTFTGIIPYTVISGEYNKQYANITGGLGMTLNPMPGLAEFDTDSKGYKLYIGNPLVLLNPEYLGMNSLVETWQKYFSTKPRFASCHSIY